jgi:hypothetical protein
MCLVKMNALNRYGIPIAVLLGATLMATLILAAP